MANTLPFPLSKKKALQVIRELSADSGRVFITRHARDRMLERCVSRPDVMCCLESGQITEGPALEANGAWRCTVNWFRAGSPLTVVAVIDYDDEGNFIVVVTTY